MKKSLLALIMTATCTLAGCNGGGESSTSSPEGPTSSPTSQPTSAPTSSPDTSDTGTQPTSQPTSAPTTTEGSTDATSTPTSAPTSTSQGPLPAAKLKIRFHVDQKSAEGAAYQTVIDSFNAEYKKYNIQVSTSFIADRTNYELQLAKDAKGGKLPDIFTFDSPNCAAYANSKYLTDLTSYLTDEEKAKIINPNEYDGKMYGIPIQESSAGFFYNKALLDQAGVDVSGITVDNPWTFSEFKEVCKKLKAKNITPVDMRMDATNDETAPYLLYPFIYAAGGSFLDSTGKVATGYFNSDASKKGYQFLRDLLDAKYTSYGIGATDFYTGKVGLYLSSGWSISFMDSKYKSTFPDRSTWGILPYPKEVIAASPNGSWSFGVGTNTAEDKRPVIELLKYITNATSSKTITDATGMIPANRDVATNYEANSPEDVLQQQLVKTSKVRTPTVGYPEFSSTFNQVISALSEGSVSDLVDNKAQVLQRKLDQIKYAD